jgi:hypothetical protein
MHRHGMRRRKKYHITVANNLGVWCYEIQINMTPQIRKTLADGGAAQLSRGDHGNLYILARCQQTQEFNPGVARSTNDSYFDQSVTP